MNVDTLRTLINEDPRRIGSAAYDSASRRWCLTVLPPRGGFVPVAVDDVKLSDAARRRCLQMASRCKAGPHEQRIRDIVDSGAQRIILTEEAFAGLLEELRMTSTTARFAMRVGGVDETTTDAIALYEGVPIYVTQQRCPITHLLAAQDEISRLTAALEEVDARLAKSRARRKVLVVRHIIRRALGRRKKR